MAVDTATVGDQPFRREPTLDLLRGFFLVLMTVDHLYGAVALVAFEAFGFVTAAEGFVFLSAFLAAKVYGRLFGADRTAFRRAVVRRALVLYSAQAALVLFTCAVVLDHDTGVPDGPYAPFARAPAEYVVKGLTFAFQPHLLDILPMYVVFVAALPWLLGGFRRSRLAVVSLSVVVWGASLMLPTEGWVEGGGVFVLPSWQLLFVLGAAMGSLSRPMAWAVPERAEVVVLATGIVVLGLACRHACDNETVEWLGQRNKLGPLRVVTTLAYATLVARYLSSALPRVRSSWLEFLGRHSLYVFVWHLPVVLLLSPPTRIVEALELRFTGELSSLPRLAIDLAVTAVAVASLLIPAALHQKYRALARSRAEARA